MLGYAPEEFDRLVRRGRALALLLGVITFAVVVTAKAGGLGWFPADPWYVNLGLFLATTLSVIGGLPLVHTAVFWRACRPPRPGFAIGRYRGRPVFASPISPLLAGWVFISQLGVLGMILPVGSTWSGSASDDDPPLRTILVVFAAIALGLHLWALFRPPALRLTADGLILNTRIPWGRTIPWDAFAPGGPTGHEARRGLVWLQARPGTRSLGAPHPVDLYGRPPLPGYFWYRLKLGNTLVDAEFLARALRTYRDDPAARAEIGTPEGLPRLQAQAPAVNVQIRAV
ncbi:hypothetical protein [Cryptosporangium sp. NPDC051539]|uniref:hypothetical protein n=1 Tax=Cryptosporangium sp. NPDC051539 TaxID=3363962 RepID=UPI003790B7F9